MDQSEQSRIKRRDTKRARRRHGQRGGTGKRTNTILEIWNKRARQIDERHPNQQSTTK